MDIEDKMVVNLGKVAIVRAAQETDQLTVSTITDLPGHRMVLVTVEELQRPITIMSGDTYAEWTKEDITNLLVKLYE